MNRKFQVILVSAFVCVAVFACKNRPPSQESDENLKKGIELQRFEAQAETALKEGRLDEARQACQKMQQIQPGYPPIYHYLGTIEKSDENYEEAVNYLEKYIELTPGQAKGYNTLGMLLFDIREYDMAIEQVSEAIRIEPGSCQLYINLGKIYTRKGKYEKAFEILEKARQIDPDEEKVDREIKITKSYIKYLKSLLDGVKRSPHLDIAYFAVALLYHQQGKFNLATDYCIRAYRCRESSSKLRKDIVQLLWNLGQRDLVLKYSQKRLKTKPDVGPLNTVAWIMAIDPGKLRNPSKALEYAKRACELTHYKKPKMLDTLAAAYAANKQFSKAIETVDKAIELGTGAGEKSWIREVKKRKALYEENKPYFEEAKIIKEFKRALKSNVTA